MPLPLQEEAFGYLIIPVTPPLSGELEGAYFTVTFCPFTM